MKNLKIKTKPIETIEKLTDFLGFNPYHKNYGGVIELTPQKAEYILKYHNGDNRPIKQTNIKAIVASINKNGFRNTGEPLIFNTAGDLTEWQHRLKAITQLGITVKAGVSCGADPDAFTKVSAAKPRTITDQIQRKHPKALPSHITTLRELLSKGLRVKIEMTNCVSFYELYIDDIKEGHKITYNFFDRTAEFGNWKRTFNAWATLMIRHNAGDTAKIFIKLLEAEMLLTSTTPITANFLTRYKEFVPFVSNQQHVDLIYALLCKASDKLKSHPDGLVQLDSFDRATALSHEKMNRKGYYRKFMVGNNIVSIN